jgi:phytoene dehydrogenase-like protein
VADRVKYRLVIIGGGVTGLGAGLACARHTGGDGILILEKEPRCGGYVTTYRRRGYAIDTTQLIPDISPLLDYLGVELELHRYSGEFFHLHRADPGQPGSAEISLPAGFGPFTEFLARRYPADAGKIKHFMEHSRRLVNSLLRFKVEPGFFDMVKMLFRDFSALINSSRTFAEYLDTFHFASAELREIFQAFSDLNALEARAIPALVSVSTLHSLLDGPCRPAGDFSLLPERLAEGFRSRGGEIRTGSLAEKVLVKDSRVAGVQVRDRGLVETESVINTGDTRAFFRNLREQNTGLGRSGSYFRKAASVPMSGSAFTVNLGLDDAAAEILGALKPGYHVLKMGGPSGFSLGITQAGSVTGGKPVLTIGAIPCAPGEWKTLRENDRDNYLRTKEARAEEYITLVERHLLSGLSRHIVFRDIATPATYARYSGSPTGSIYDQAPVLSNFGRNRLPMRTPVRGLYNAEFLHGVYCSLLAGLQAADAICGGAVLGRRVSLPI